MEHITLLLGCVTMFLIFILYYYHQKRKWYFESKGIPYVNPILLLGSAGPVIFNIRSRAEQLQVTYNSHPTAKYVGFYELTDPVIMLCDLELMKSVLVKNFDHFINHVTPWDRERDPLVANSLLFIHDEQWKNARSVLGRNFTSSRMKIMFELASNYAIDCTNNLMTLSTNHSIEMEMKDLFMRFSTDTMAQSFFGLNVNSMKDATNKFYTTSKKMTRVDFIGSLKVLLSRIFPLFAKITKLHIMNKEAVDYFYDIVADTVNTRESKNYTSNDSIQLMLEAKDSGNTQFQNINNIASHAFILLFGGVETTTTAMSYACYELAHNPNIQNKLRAEIDDVKEKCGGNITYEIVREMKYLTAVVNEALRKFPPAIQTDRICSEAFELPPALPNSQPFTIQPGTVIVIPIYAFHHDPKYFNDPQTFDPERFMDLNKEPPGFLPFGIGPRQCVAQTFGIMMIKLMLFHLLSRCELLPSPKTPSMVMTNNLFIVESKYDFWLRIISREQ